MIKLALKIGNVTVEYDNKNINLNLNFSMIGVCVCVYLKLAKLLGFVAWQTPSLSHCAEFH